MNFQIEEALKLYQNAVKLHSQGPRFYSAAATAYRELFESEIFTWEESLTEAQLIELYKDTEVPDEDSGDALDPILTSSATGVDGTPSSLPQILYLANKNHGQFQLDQLRDMLSNVENLIVSSQASSHLDVITAVTSSSLKLFVEALDKDDTDLELWRLVSRICGFLGSHRLARYCSEAVLDSDEGGFDAWTEPFGLEVGFAEEQLKPLLKTIEDQLTQSQLPKSFGRHGNIISSFKKRIDPYPWIPTASSKPPSEPPHTNACPQYINVPLRSYASCGKAILLQIDSEAKGLITPDPGATYSLVLPSAHANDLSAPAVSYLVNGDSAPEPLLVPMNGNPGSSTEDTSHFQDGGSHAAADGPIVQSTTRSPTEENPIVSADVTEYSTMIHESAIHGNEILEVADTVKVPEQPQTDAGPSISLSLPTRKRSLEVADVADPTDGGRSRSKRIKARGSFDPDGLKDSIGEDWAKWYEEQLQIYHGADESAFELIESILSSLGSRTLISLPALRNIVSNQFPSTKTDYETTPLQSVDLAAQDLKLSLDAWDLAKSKAFLNGHDPKDPAGGFGGGRNPSVAAFLESSNQNSQTPSSLDAKLQEDDRHPIDKFVGQLEQQDWVSLSQLSYRWLYTVLVSDEFDEDPSASEAWYKSNLWPAALKESVVQMLVCQDQAIYSQLNRDIAGQEDVVPIQPHDDSIVPNVSVGSMAERSKAKDQHILLAQTIFELHIDVYGLITRPSSKVDEETRILQGGRLRRWAALTSHLVNQSTRPENGDVHQRYALDELSIRFLWASVVCNSLLEPTLRDSTILCYQDLIHMLQSLDEVSPDRAPFTIRLPNNAIIPEISVKAAQNEISRLTTMEFFMGILNPEHTDPLSTIETLEPLLDLSIKHRDGMATQDPEAVTGVPSLNTQLLDAETEEHPDTNLIEALTFLKQGSVPLRLFLWQKLRDAYRAITYPPQVVSCDLRMISLIVDHLGSSSYHDTSRENRQSSLLRWLHRLDDHVTRALTVVLTKPGAYDCLDGQHVRTSLKALTTLQRILHVFALWEDTIRVGKIPPPPQISQNANKGLARSTDKFRDMIVKVWTLQYTLFKETLVQNSNLVDSISRDLTQYLERAHQALGLRCYCSLAEKAFLRLMKKEIEAFKVRNGLDVDMSQLMYDLYGVKMSLNATEMQDHGCLTESLDKSTAFEIMDLVMAQVKRISIKDLLKSDLKFTIDRMQQVIRIPKINNATARIFNNRLVINYLKAPLNPYNLYRSMRGLGGLCGIVADSEGADIASKGWYALLGHISLAKFRSTKRSSAGSTDDLSISKTFLRHDLEFNTDRWETWYRLSQVYDAMIEEDTTWTADKLENHMDELADLQRKSIHCYSMALAVATRSAEGSFEDASKIADLCAEFGTRVYASTREPFSMKAFDLDHFKRHYNSRAVGMYQDLPFRSLQLYPAWKLASILLRRASTQKPQNWV